jgi:hypothetical protein
MQPESLQSGMADASRQASLSNACGAAVARFRETEIMRDTPFVLSAAAKNMHDLHAVHEELFGGDNMSGEYQMNLVQYGRLLAMRSSDMVQFLIAAKGVSAGSFDVPERALVLIANDREIEANILKSFEEIEEAHKQLRVLIAAAKRS